MRTTSFLFYNFLIIFLSVGILAVSAQEKKYAQQTIHDKIAEETEQILDSLIQIRRDIHRHPEIAGSEKRTSQLISDYLTDLGLEVTTGIGGHGVVGMLECGKGGKTIAWRADIDALKTDFPDPVDFRSETDGLRHICGHDVHTVVGLGMAKVLSTYKHLLKGTIYFLFQPAEENITGAKAMIEEGVLKKMNAEEMYALHISPFPVGTFSTKKNEMYGTYKKVEITISKNADSTATIQTVKDAILDIEQIVMKEKFYDPLILGDPVVGVAGTNSIFADYVAVGKKIDHKNNDDDTVISAYMSLSTKAKFDGVQKKIEKSLKNSKYGHLITSINYVPITYTPDNDPELVAKSTNTITQLYGKNSFIPLTGMIPGGTGDDFALFQEEVPGVYFFLGGSNYEEGKIAMPHTPDFVVDESSIKVGVQYFSSLLVERMSAK